MSLPEWPKNPPTADEMIRFYACEGLWHSSRSIDLIDAGASREHRYFNAASAIAAHDRVLLLKRLAELDPAAADEMAARMWLAADAGDSYGEWLWQWAEEAGLDAEAICDDSLSKLAANPPAPRPDTQGDETSELCVEKHCGEPAVYGMTWRIDGVALEFYLCEQHFDAVGSMSTDTRPMPNHPDEQELLLVTDEPYHDNSWPVGIFATIPQAVEAAVGGALHTTIEDATSAIYKIEGREVVCLWGPSTRAQYGTPAELLESTRDG